MWPANGRGTAMLVGMGLALEPPCYFRWASQVALVVKSLAADAGEDVFRSLSRVVPPARAPCLVGFPLGSAQDGQ